MLVCDAGHAYIFCFSIVFGLNSIYRFKVKNFKIDLCIKYQLNLSRFQFLDCCR